MWEPEAAGARWARVFEFSVVQPFNLYIPMTLRATLRDAWLAQGALLAGVVGLPGAEDPALIVGACAVGAMATLATRPVCSVLALRWRSAADVDARRWIAGDG